LPDNADRAVFGHPRPDNQNRDEQRHRHRGNQPAEQQATADDRRTGHAGQDAVAHRIGQVDQPAR
jgi:hypothetical protein